jgi:hypothetical protein
LGASTPADCNELETSDCVGAPSELKKFLRYACAEAENCSAGFGVLTAMEPLLKVLK